MDQVEHILPCRNKLGEGPLWSEEQEVLYWVDIENDCYCRFDPISDHSEIIQTGVAVGVLAERERGGLVLATKKGFAFWDETSKTLRYGAQPFGEDPRLRFNDGAVDCRGRFWAGSKVEDGQEHPDNGTLYRLDPDGSVHVMLTNIGVPNGIGWSPDNTIMYFADSPRQIITAYDFDAENGTITQPRPFVLTGDEEGGLGLAGFPDGLCVDSDGYVWSAFWDGGKVIRFAPDGTIERTIDMPVARPTACTFGGAGLNELYITSAAVDDVLKQQYPLSGDLFRVRTDIKGQPKYKFAG